MNQSSGRNQFLTLKELAARWRYSERQIRRLIKARKIAAHDFGGRWRFSIEDVEADEALCRRPRRP